MKNSEHIDNYFNKQLYDFQMQPSEAVWENVAAQLQQKKKKRGFIFWRNSLLLGMLLLSSTLLGIRLFQPKTSTPPSELSEVTSPTSSTSASLTTSSTAFNEKAPTHEESINLNSSTILENNNTYKSNNQIVKSNSNKKSNLSNTSFTLATTTIEPTTSSTENIFTTKNTALKDEAKVLESNVGEGLSSSNTSVLNTNSANTNSQLSFEAVEQLSPAKPNLLESKIDMPEKIDYYPGKTRFKKRDKYCYGDNTPDHAFSMETYTSISLIDKSLTSKSSQYNSLLSEKNKLEKGLMAWGIGVRGIYTFKRDWSFRMGLEYNQIREQFTHQDPTTKITTYIYIIQTETGPKEVTTTKTEKGLTITETVNKLNFIELPISAGYRFRNTKWAIGVNFGASIGLLLDPSGNTLDENKNMVSFDNLAQKGKAAFANTTGMSLMGSIRFEMPFKNESYLFFEPTLKYQLKSISGTNYPIEQRYNFTGTQLGLGFKF